MGEAGLFSGVGLCINLGHLSGQTSALNLKRVMPAYLITQPLLATTTAVPALDPITRYDVQENEMLLLSFCSQDSEG